MRTADGREPEMELVRVHVHGDARQVENLDQLFGETHATRDSISMQRWAIAPGVSRFTLSQTLPPGEYVFMEIVQGQGTQPLRLGFRCGRCGRARNDEIELNVKSDSLRRFRAQNLHQVVRKSRDLKRLLQN